MKIVVNKCYGGFSLSGYGLKRLQELIKNDVNTPCYFYRGCISTKYEEIDIAETQHTVFWTAFDEKLPVKLTKNQSSKSFNEWYDTHNIDNRSVSRNDPLLVQVVEELGDKANGSCASLAIVDIPDDVSWEIEEYDGNEWISETHRTW